MAVLAQTNARLELVPWRLVEQLKTSLDLDDDAIAGAVQSDRRTVRRWCRSGAFPQRETRARLAELHGLATHLRDTFTTDEAARGWLHSPSRYLGGLTPADALRVGRIDRVAAALEALDSGVFVERPDESTSGATHAACHADP